MIVNKTKYGCSSRKKHVTGKDFKLSVERVQFFEIISSTSFQKHWKLRCRG